MGVHVGYCLQWGKVVDTRYNALKNYRRRRYECTKCHRRFTTKEYYVEQYKHMSELDKPIWAVISFRRIEAGDITYAEAVQIRTELKNKGVPGLVIITSEAAGRLAEFSMK